LSKALAAGPANAATTTDNAGSKPNSLLAKNVKKDTHTERA
jgi:hypothetical protein